MKPMQKASRLGEARPDQSRGVCEGWTIWCLSPDCPVPVTGLFGDSREHGGGSKIEGKSKPSFAEFLAKYKKEGVARKKGNN